MRNWMILAILTTLVLSCGSSSGSSNPTEDVTTQEDSVLNDGQPELDAVDVPDTKPQNDVLDVRGEEIPLLDVVPLDQTGTDDVAIADLAVDDTAGDVGVPDLVEEVAQEVVADVVEDTTVGPMPDPDQVGAYGVATATAQVSQGGRNTPVKAYIPQGVMGKVPVVIFMPGAQLQANQYDQMLTRLASHGFVVIGADPQFSVFSGNHVEMAKDAKAVVDWAVGGAAPFAAVVDVQKIGVTGHSLGGKVSVMLANTDPRVKALLGIDPVNGGSPLTGYTAALPDVVPEQVQNLAIPLGFAGETTDSSGGLMGQDCAPAAQNFQTFSAAATSATWSAEWTFTGADHMDFLDNPNCGMTCNMCVAGTADPAVVKAGMWTLEVAFFRLHFYGESEMDAYLIGAKVPAGISVKTAQ